MLLPGEQKNNSPKISNGAKSRVREAESFYSTDTFLLQYFLISDQKIIGFQIRELVMVSTFTLLA